MINSYRESHTQFRHGVQYDRVLYATGAYDADIWTLEQNVLTAILKRHFPTGIGDLLDFACGTGRILSFVRPHTRNATGIDISEEMIREARGKVSDAELLLGDVTSDQQILPAGAAFECITCFRFFLNAEPDLREAGVRAIARVTRPGGKFVFNNHGNETSLLRAVIAVRKWLGLSTQNALPYRELKALVERNGFQVVETHGICFMPRLAARLMPRGLWLAIEETLGKIQLLRNFGIYQIHVAVRLPTSEIA